MDSIAKSKYNHQKQKEKKKNCNKMLDITVKQMAKLHSKTIGGFNKNLYNFIDSLHFF